SEGVNGTGQRGVCTNERHRAGTNCLARPSRRRIVTKRLTLVPRPPQRRPSQPASSAPARSCRRLPHRLLRPAFSEVTDEHAHAAPPPGRSAGRLGCSCRRLAAMARSRTYRNLQGKRTAQGLAREPPETAVDLLRGWQRLLRPC